MQTAQVINRFAGVWEYFRNAQYRLTELLDLNPATVGEGGFLLPPPTAGLEVEGITVAYDDDVVLRDFDLAAAPGELVVIHGAPGSGKTTLAAAMAGLMPLDEGAVFLDGVPIGRLGREVLAPAVLVNSEDPFLFSGSLHDNLVSRCLAARTTWCCRRRFALPVPTTSWRACRGVSTTSWAIGA